MTCKTSISRDKTWHLLATARATGWLQPMWRQMRAAHCNWLYKVRSPKKFPRESRRTSWCGHSKKYKSQKAQETNCKMTKAHKDRIANVKATSMHRGITGREVTVCHSPLVSSLVSAGSFLGLWDIALSWLSDTFFDSHTSKPLSPSSVHSFESKHVSKKKKNSNGKGETRDNSS